MRLSFRGAIFILLSKLSSIVFPAQRVMKIGLITLRTFFVISFFANVDSQNSALSAGEAVLENINNGEFTAVVKDVANTVAPFLKAFTSVVKLILGIQSSSTESTELKYMRNLSESINRRFDEVNAQFNDVKNLIDWSAVQVSYGMLESNIHAVSEQFSRIYQVPESGMNEQRKMFLISYRNGYIDSGTKLFTAFMQDHGVISQGLLRPAMKYTRNDRGKMRTFMLGILKLLLMAARVELAYLGAVGSDLIAPYYIHLWQIRTEQVQEKMKAIDLEMKNVYYSQSLSDTDRFSMSSRNLRLSNHDFSRNLYEALSTKYYWRDWLVVVSTHTEGRHDAHTRVCNGAIKSVSRTKDIVIDSVERDKSNFDINEVQSMCISLNQTCQNHAHYISCDHGHHGNHKSKRCGGYVYPGDAIDIFNWFGSVKTSCLTYSSIGIIATNKNPVYYTGPAQNSHSRLFVSHVGHCQFNVHFFG